MDEASFNLPTFLVIACAVVAPTLLSPLGRRVRSAVATVCVVMTIARMQDFGSIAVAAKVASGGSLLVLAWAASQAPGGRRPVSSWNLIALVAALVGCVVVLGAEDWTKALAFRVQALFAAVAGLAVARTMVDGRSKREPLLGVAIGAGLGAALTLASLVIDPADAFASGYGRFSPFGCNPVQIGVLYLLGTVFGLYFSLDRHPALPVWAASLITAVSVLGAALTVSRMAILGIVIASAPMLWRLTRRPVVTLTMVTLVAVVLPRMFGGLEGANLDHLEASRDSHRLEFMAIVVDEIRDRPWSGLLYSEGIAAHDGEFNAHNAYLEMFFLGGAFYAVPMIAVLTVAGWGAVASLWSPMARSAGGGLLVRCLAVFYLLTLANGMVTIVNNYATFAIAVVQWVLTHHYLLPAPVAPRQRSAAVTQRSKRVRQGRIVHSGLAPRALHAKDVVHGRDRRGVGTAPH